MNSFPAISNARIAGNVTVDDEGVPYVAVANENE
jgi:hypothetical protein